jgi:hypothetical protein
MQNHSGGRRLRLPTTKSASSILVRPANSDLTKSFGVSPDFVGEQMQDIRTPAIKNGDASGVSAQSVSISIVCFSVLFTAAGSFTRVVLAQDLAKTILPITQWKWIALGAAARFGTGFCSDRECRLIGTNYHVAVMARPYKMNGQEVIHRYLAPGPHDDGATLNEAVSGSPLRYTLSRDLAIFELRRPLPHYHGMAFSARENNAVAVAVPIQSLADFVSKVQPWQAEIPFPSFHMETFSPTGSDLYPKFVPAPSAVSIQYRPDEPAQIKALREKAQLLANGIRNLEAVQTFAWGSGANNVPAALAEYEVKVLDGFHRFREYPEGKKELENVPFPPVNTVVVPGGEWSELPQMVGTTLRLKIHQALSPRLATAPNSHL